MVVRSANRASMHATKRANKEEVGEEARARTHLDDPCSKLAKADAVLKTNVASNKVALNWFSQRHEDKYERLLCSE